MRLYTVVVGLGFTATKQPILLLLLWLYKGALCSVVYEQPCLLEPPTISLPPHFAATVAGQRAARRDTHSTVSEALSSEENAAALSWERRRRRP